MRALEYFFVNYDHGRAVLVEGKENDIFFGVREPRLWLCWLGPALAVTSDASADDLLYLHRVGSLDTAQDVVDRWRAFESRVKAMRKIARKAASDAVRGVPVGARCGS